MKKMEESRNRHYWDIATIIFLILIFIVLIFIFFKITDEKTQCLASPVQYFVDLNKDYSCNCYANNRPGNFISYSFNNSLGIGK